MKKIFLMTMVALCSCCSLFAAEQDAGAGTPVVVATQNQVLVPVPDGSVLYGEYLTAITTFQNASSQLKSVEACDALLANVDAWIEYAKQQEKNLGKNTFKKVMRLLDYTRTVIVAKKSSLEMLAQFSVESVVATTQALQDRLAGLQSVVDCDALLKDIRVFVGDLQKVVAAYKLIGQENDPIVAKIREVYTVLQKLWGDVSAKRNELVTGEQGQVTELLAQLEQMKQRALVLVEQLRIAESDEQRNAIIQSIKEQLEELSKITSNDKRVRSAINYIANLLNVALKNAQENAANAEIQLVDNNIKSIEKQFAAMMMQSYAFLLEEMKKQKVLADALQEKYPNNKMVKMLVVKCDKSIESATKAYEYWRQRAPQVEQPPVPVPVVPAPEPAPAPSIPVGVSRYDTLAAVISEMKPAVASLESIQACDAMIQKIDEMRNSFMVETGLNDEEKAKLTALCNELVLMINQKKATLQQ